MAEGCDLNGVLGRESQKGFEGIPEWDFVEQGMVSGGNLVPPTGEGDSICLVGGVRSRSEREDGMEGK